MITNELPRDPHEQKNETRRDSNILNGNNFIMLKFYTVL